MTRRSNKGRVTTPQNAKVEPQRSEIEPLWKRQPIKFWVIVIAVAAMVLSSAVISLGGILGGG